jgi:hypothetical protein
MWIYLNNLDLQKQWIDRGQLPVPSQRESASKRMVLLCVWFNYEGRIYYEFVPDARMTNADVYAQQLEKMYTVFARKYPALVNRRHVLLQQDNARPHTTKKTLQKIEELKLLNCYRIPLLVLILSYQTTSVSFYGPVPSW